MARRMPTSIAALDGVDCLWVGHFDLSVSLGIPGEFDHPKFLEAIDRTIAAARRSTARRWAGWCPTPSRASRFYKQGFDFICYSGDVWVLRDALTCGHDHAARRLPSMSQPYRVALSGDFRKADGSPTFPDFDLDAAAQGEGRRDGLPRQCQSAARRSARGFRRADPAGPPLRRRERSEVAAGLRSSPASASATTRWMFRPARPTTSRSSSRPMACAARWPSRSSPSSWRSPAR